MKNKNKSRKIYCVGHTSYINWMEPTELVSSIKDCDLLCLIGGADATPETAREKYRHSSLYCDPLRDKYELKIWDEAINRGTKIIAICRSAQMGMCVEPSKKGKLVRDQDNPYHEHEIIMNDGDKIISGSSHHNAMWPWEIPQKDWSLLGYTIGVSNYHQNSEGKECVIGVVPENKEVEIVHLKSIKALLHQHHFEYTNWQRDMRYRDSLNYLRNQLDKFMVDELD